MTQYVIGWIIEGHNFIVQDYYSGKPRFFDSQEEASAIAQELVKDIGECRVLTVVEPEQPVSDPSVAEN